MSYPVLGVNITLSPDLRVLDPSTRMGRATLEESAPGAITEEFTSAQKSDALDTGDPELGFDSGVGLSVRLTIRRRQNPSLR